MKIWILRLAKNSTTYSVDRFLSMAEQMDITVELVRPAEFEIIVSKEGRKSILREGRVVDLPDCVIPRMGSGTTYFALAVIRQLEKLGVFVLNSSHSIEIAKDKLASMQVLASNNIPIPKTMLAKMPLDPSIVSAEFSYPLVLKTTSGSKGKGVMLCNDADALEDVINLINKSKKGFANLILQEFVKTSRGKDIRIFIIGGRAIGAMLRKAPEGKFKANFSAGGEVENFSLNPEVEWLAVESVKLLDLEIAGVDILFDEKGYKVCEVNSSPGFEGFEQATGINVPKEIYNFIQIRLQGELG